jgi:hypothetical protein
MTTLLHELWLGDEGQDTFCLAGPMGDGARASLPAGATLIWTVWAESHVDAMRKTGTFGGGANTRPPRNGTTVPTQRNG